MTFLSIQTTEKLTVLSNRRTTIVSPYTRWYLSVFEWSRLYYTHLSNGFLRLCTRVKTFSIMRGAGGVLG